MKYSTLSSSLMLLLASTSFSAHANENKESQTTIFYGGPVITMEKSQPRAEAVVTSKYGKIVYVGSEQEALKQYPNSKK